MQYGAYSRGQRRLDRWPKARIYNVSAGPFCFELISAILEISINGLLICYLVEAKRRVVETLDWLSTKYGQKNRAIDESRYGEWVQASRKEIKDLWSDEDAEHWHLFMFVTDAAWRRQGVGTALLKWGVEKADKDGLAIGLEASTKEGYSLYSKFNFQTIGESALGTAVAAVMKRRPV